MRCYRFVVMALRHLFGKMQWRMVAREDNFLKDARIYFFSPSFCS